MGLLNLEWMNSRDGNIMDFYPLVYVVGYHLISDYTFRIYIQNFKQFHWPRQVRISGKILTINNETAKQWLIDDSVRDIYNIHSVVKSLVHRMCLSSLVSSRDYVIVNLMWLKETYLGL